MLQHKGQTSIEFLVILSIILILSLFFVVSIHNTFDINISVYEIKNKTLELISLSDSSIIIKNINYAFVDDDITLTLNLQTINTLEEPIVSEDYLDISEKIKKITKFNDVKVNINYIH